MKILLHAHTSGEIYSRLRDPGHGFSHRGAIELETTFQGLEAQLHRQKASIDVVVLAPASRADLRDLLTLRDLLDGLPIILVLPDAEKETVSMGHQLYPRYVSQVDDGLEERLDAVLTRMNRKRRSA